MVQRRNIIMLSWEFPPRIVGGIAAHVHDLSRALAQTDLDVHVITLEFPGAKGYEEIEGVHVHRVDSYKYSSPDFASWTFMMNLNLQAKGIELIRSLKGNVDVVHAHDWLVAMAAVGLKHLLRVPLLATIHSTEYGRRNGLHTNYQTMIHQTESWLSHEAWRVICCSDYMASQVSWAFGLPRQNIEAIPNGVDLDKFRANFDRENFRKKFASPDEKLVLFVGRLVYEKGAGVLVEAIPKVLSNVDAKFVCVGEGYMKDVLISRTHHLGITHKIYFTGFLDDPTVKLLYRVADVCVVPSLYEPFGIVALEGMAARTPVVTTGAGGLSEIVEHDKTGVKVYLNDPDSLAWGILRVLLDKKYAERLTQNAYKKVVEVYDWNRIAERTKSVYERILHEYEKGSWKPVSIQSSKPTSQMSELGY